MKQLTFIITSVLLLTMILSGCSQSSNNPIETCDAENNRNPIETDLSQNGRYSIKICGFSDSISSAKHTLEYDNWSKSNFIDTNAEKKLSISVAGLTAEAEYKKSEQRYSEFYNTHLYYDQNQNVFRVTDSGMLCLYFAGKSDTSDKIDNAYAETECKDIACDFLSDIVDISDYSIRSEYDESSQTYTFYFEKYADGFLCADKAEIEVKSNGSIPCFSSWMLGQIPGDAVTDFDREEIEAQIISRLDKEYAKAKEIYDEVSYENFEYTLTKTSKDKYALICAVDVNCKEFFGEFTSLRGERIEFLIQ